ncbi:MAG: tyrosine-type recombinase/integrase [Desulfosporosinus sp.]
MAKQRNPNGIGSYKLRKDGRIQWTQKKDGKPRVLYGKTLGELQAKVKKVSDLPVTSTKLTVSDWFEKWLDIYVKQLKKKATYDQYKTLYEQHIKPIIGHRRLSGVKPLDIQTVIAKMNDKKRASKTMKHVKSIMNIAFNKALDDKLISSTPVVKIEIPVKQAKTRKVLTVEDLIKLYKAMERSRWIWSIRFLLVTGLRRGEMLALKWTDIDTENKRITIDESNSSSGIGDTKSAKVHYVPLSDKALGYLDGQKLMLEKEANPILHNEKLKKTALVFPSKNGTMIRPDSYYTMLRRFAIKAEIKASAHCIRHTFVYLNREAMSLKELQAILGHDESTTTLDLYGDILEETMTKTASKIDDVFDKVDKEIKRIEEEKAEKENMPMGKLIEFKRKSS